MERFYEVFGKKVVFENVTAINSALPEEGRKQALFIHYLMDDLCTCDGLLFSLDYFQFPSDNDEAEYVLRLYKHCIVSDSESLESIERFDYTTFPAQIKILMMDGCTKSEAIAHLNRGAIVFERNDFINNLDSYSEEWNLTVKEEVKMSTNAILGKNPDPLIFGWVKYRGNEYYILYVL